MAALAHPDRAPAPQPVPWRRMVWVSWRGHRLALAGLAALSGVAAIYLVANGLPLHHAYAAMTSCRPAGSRTCQQVAQNFLDTYTPGLFSTLSTLHFLPALVGVFIGAPLLAREFETGTFRYTWTQGFGRTRFTIAKLALLAVAVTVVPGALSVLVFWYVGPLTGGAGPIIAFNLMSSDVFDLLGLALAAWSLTAFAIGVLAGALIRRVVPAMGATLGAWAGLVLVTGGALRQRYLPPVTSDVAHPGAGTQANQGLVLGYEWARGGKPVPLSVVNQTLRAIHLKAVNGFSFEPVGSRPPARVDPYHYLAQHGYLLEVIYQPDSRFWTFQGIEAAWLLALSLLLFAATVWLVRRRAA